ncbi:hypothetical protein GTS_56570 [Gandjariella thermophila]|uniref:DUF7008 domain-containing protein n=1 Tax=Gandjariella thermophila TaxID=1931992 RepID=A0A4D4JEE4_9PSEU|nr:hypothetical protein GTS_56570 [Gandjariella thermophila]
MTYPLERTRRLDDLAQRLSASTPASIAQDTSPTRELLDEAHGEYERIRARMIAEQEELDWDVYQRYGLLSDAEAAEVVIPDPSTVPGIKLGERAFEIVLARKMAAGEVETQWFARHGSTPITEVPAHWPEDYKRVVEARIRLIESRRDIALIERPECKRRWSAESWESQQERALREWLQDRLEARHLWYAEDASGIEQPTPRTVAQLADLLRGDADFGDVARLWASDALGRTDADLAEIVGALVDDEHVPFLAAYRYKPSALGKRAEWERVWDLQRQEDAIAAELGQDVTHPEVRREVEKRLGTIPVPPKYASSDFLRNSYWRHRGKLDVPKERFISYPAASREGDGSLLLGWAGWDHREQAQALAVLITQRRTDDGWDKERVAPLLAGLAELLPWVKQWHGEVDPIYGASPGEIYEGFLDGQLAELDLARDDLARWRPTGRVDVSPLPRRSGTPSRGSNGKPRAPRASREPDPQHTAAVLEFAAGGPVTASQVAELTGLDTPGARKLLKHLVDRGDLVQTGQRRGTKYHLPQASPAS